MIQYCLLSLLLAIIFYSALTTSGFDRIYNAFLRFSSIDIQEITSLLADDEMSEDIKRAKLIVFSKSGHDVGDLTIALNAVNLTDRIKQADIWVEQIPNSEASFLNRYLKSGDNFYLTGGLYEILNADHDNYRDIASRLYASSIVQNKSYTIVGIADECSLHAQITNLRMLIKEAEGNPIHADLEAILDNTDVTDIDYIEAIADSLTANEAMYKEHFLTEYKEVATAIRAFQIYKNANQSTADTFCELYREMPTETFVAFMNSSDAASFIDEVASQEAIFQKRHLLIEAFDFTENDDLPVTVSMIDTERMHLFDLYGRFVYALSGKRFQPTPRETGRYYLRIETVKK